MPMRWTRCPRAAKSRLRSCAHCWTPPTSSMLLQTRKMSRCSATRPSLDEEVVDNGLGGVAGVVLTEPGAEGRPLSGVGLADVVEIGECAEQLVVVVAQRTGRV